MRRKSPRHAPYRPGVLLDTGPLVALLSARDHQHPRAVQALGACSPPLRCCEAVLSEACFLAAKLHPAAPADLIAMARTGVFEVSLAASGHWPRIQDLLERYRDLPMSFADACLVRCAEIWREPRILTFDRHFRIYRWGANQPFQLVI